MNSFLTSRVLKKYFPLVLIISVWLVFSFPYLFQNKTPFPSSYQLNFFPPWSTYSEFASPVKNNAMPDIVTQIVPWKKFTIDTLKSGQIPLWNPYSFSGTPHLANYQSAVLSPTNILFFLFPFFDAWTLLVILQPLLAGIFMYIFMRSINTSPLGSTVSSVSFMFCGFITTWMAYGTLGYAILFFPLALYFIQKYFETSKNIFLFFLSFTIPLSFFSGHFQTSVYLFIAVSFFVLFKGFSQKNLSKSVHLLGFLTLGLMLSMPQIIPSLEFYSLSVRQSIIQKIEVIPWNYIVTLFAPDYLGNPVTRNDWFGHYAEWNGFAGVIPMLLLPYGLLKKQVKIKYYFLILLLASLLLSFNSPIQDLILHLKVPILSTSAASRIIVLFSFAVAGLAGIGFDALFLEKGKMKYKNLLLVTLGQIIIFFTLWCFIFLKLGLTSEQAHVARNNSILPTAMFVSFLGMLIATLVFKKKLYKHTIIFIILLFVIFDMLRFAIKWMPLDEKKNAFIPVLTTQKFEELSGEERFVLDGDAENSVFYSLRTLGGYDPLYIGRYGEFIQFISSGQKNKGERSIVRFPKDGLYTKEAIELMGVKYIVHKLSDGEFPWAFPFRKYPPEQFKIIHDDGHYQVYENNSYIPRAHIVHNVEIINKDKQILERLFNSSFDKSSSVILEEKIDLESDKNATSQAKIVIDQPNKITIKTNSSSEGLLILSDANYPGWKVRANGKDEKVFQANYVFRGAPIPKGENFVEFTYKPQSFMIGLTIAAFGLLSLVVIAIFKHYNKSK